MDLDSTPNGEVVISLVGVTVIDGVSCDVTCEESTFEMNDVATSPTVSSRELCSESDITSRGVTSPKEDIRLKWELTESETLDATEEAEVMTSLWESRSNKPALNVLRGSDVIKLFNTDCCDVIKSDNVGFCVQFVTRVGETVGKYAVVSLCVIVDLTSAVSVVESGDISTSTDKSPWAVTSLSRSVYV